VLDSLTCTNKNWKTKVTTLGVGQLDLHNKNWKTKVKSLGVGQLELHK
jgi:hypothetical protein